MFENTLHSDAMYSAIHMEILCQFAIYYKILRADNFVLFYWKFYFDLYFVCKVLSYYRSAEILFIFILHSSAFLIANHHEFSCIVSFLPKWNGKTFSSRSLKCFLF